MFFFAILTFSIFYNTLPSLSFDPFTSLIARNIYTFKPIASRYFKSVESVIKLNMKQ